ncbi:DUF4129 domain-containing protein [Halogeometricum limi]|uniref:Protein-glutamine gamma-glutamyltransferase-like C-terminal domain-containing protein n=1 Tax=Halogeometricum limi TaxID=555875 RepID=A0A1I6FTC2_9EURY|nr:DUF4129 domain-containing protein [Halogeometricum limi]SFR33154.1 protein of unknown function [Halogeometricum limi]
MKLHTVTTVLVVCSCIAAVGVASTTLESTFETTPDEAVDLDYDVVPISPDTAGKLDRAMNPGSGAERSASGGGEAESRAAPDSGTSDRQRSNAAESDVEDRRAEQSNDDRPSSASQSANSESGTTAEQSLLDRLLDLLATVLPYLVLFGVLAGVSGVLVRYRDRIAERLRTQTSERTARTTPRELDPDNVVERAWVSVLTAANVDDPARRTPAECADAAVASGLDPDGVERIRRAFEEVRYGDHEVTEARREQVERDLSRLNLAGGRR